MRGGGTGLIFNLATTKVKVVNLDTPGISTFSFVAGKVSGVADLQQLLIICLYRTGPVNQKFYQDLNDLLGKACLQYEYILIKKN